MRKFFILLVILVFVGCYKSWREYYSGIDEVCWGSDGKVLFLYSKEWREYNEDPFSGEPYPVEIEDSIFLYEVNADRSGMRCVCFIGLNEYYSGMSSAGDWVVYSRREGINGEDEICVVRRDGSERYNTGVRGRHPDFSPDASKIVYEKPDSGIWVMNRDGSNNHPIWGDSINRMPAWSSDGGRIALERDEGRGDRDIWIIDTSGSNRVKLLDTEFQYPIGPFVWAPADTNAIIVYNTIYYLDSFAQIDTTRGLPGASYYGWSPNGEYLIGIDTEGVFIMRVNGTNKVYINP